MMMNECNFSQCNLGANKRRIPALIWQEEKVASLKLLILMLGTIFGCFFSLSALLRLALLFLHKRDERWQLNHKVTRTSYTKCTARTETMMNDDDKNFAAAAVFAPDPRAVCVRCVLFTLLSHVSLVGLAMLQWLSCRHSGSLRMRRIMGNKNSFF